MRCTCIISFFNEGKRIGKVLDEVVKVKNIDEIICIDDGSTDGASEFIKKNYPKIKLIINPKNSGKTEAIKVGLDHAKGEYILLLDADLRNFKGSEVEKAVKRTLENRADMVILRRVNAPWIIKLNRGDTLLSGERILKKDDFKKLLEIKKPKGYQLEFAMNQYMTDYHKKVFWMPSSALNTYPQHKRGFVKGMYRIVSMQANILSYIGLRNFIRQELFFCTKELN